MKPLHLTRLMSGGIVTNYYCSSKCRHCTYGCSPSWGKKYMSEETASLTLKKIASMGCRSVHIGGGEPLLDLPGLEKVIGRANQEGINIEYIETNSSWYRDEESCIHILLKLKGMGVDTLLISIDPFHNEYVPFYKVKGVMEACRKTGVSIFPWIQDFYPDLNAFDDSRPHSLDEYRERFGNAYLTDILSRYRINFRGRALLTYKDLFSHTDTDRITESSNGCSELAGTYHFHFDLFGNYIPGLCSGMSIHRDDLGRPLDPSKYPFLTLLFHEGAKGFLKTAREEYGYTPLPRYFSKCHLCFDIRRFLVREKGINSVELQPLEYYDYI